MNKCQSLVSVCADLPLHLICILYIFKEKDMYNEKITIADNSQADKCCMPVKSNPDDVWQERKWHFDNSVVCILLDEEISSMLCANWGGKWFPNCCRKLDKRFCFLKDVSGKNENRFVSQFFWNVNLNPVSSIRQSISTRKGTRIRHSPHPTSQIQVR